MFEILIKFLLLIFISNHGIGVDGKTNGFLKPSYMDIASNRRIVATSTCGVDLPTNQTEEQYCLITGFIHDHHYRMYDKSQGQDQDNRGLGCDVCQEVGDKSFPAENMVDKTPNSRWQSPPLSRGAEYSRVNITIDLEQKFHVAYVFIRMANSPRPGMWILEKSDDYGKTFKPWQYFAEGPNDCLRAFNRRAKETFDFDDEAICSTRYSKSVPLENGEIAIRLISNRPSARNFSRSEVLQDWTTATHVKFQFLRPITFAVYAKSGDSESVMQRYYYAINEIRIGGRCLCNGHADQCVETEVDVKNDELAETTVKKVEYRCNCQHNTCGMNCDECCSGFTAKKWRRSYYDETFECEPCNCHQHSLKCSYNETIELMKMSLDIHGELGSGGVCQECEHNTEGINCERCKFGYYRPLGKQLTDMDACQKCQCDHPHATGGCAEGSGKCECKTKYSGINCDRCADGYYDYPDCKPCECNLNGTLSRACNAEGGRCSCLPNFQGEKCDECVDGYYGIDCAPCDCVNSYTETCEMDTGRCQCYKNYDGLKCTNCAKGYYDYPACHVCDCDKNGSDMNEMCDQITGRCNCREEFDGIECSQCKTGYYGYPSCRSCQCSIYGSTDDSCSLNRYTNEPQCHCKPNFAGNRCDRCAAGYFNYPECHPCNCVTRGAEGISCNDIGECRCRSAYSGKQCERCIEGYYGHPDCRKCNCNPDGIRKGFERCNQDSSVLCECKKNVVGQICNECRSSFFNLSRSNPNGCEECNCRTEGTLGEVNICETNNGKCECKIFVGDDEFIESSSDNNIDGRRCNKCRSGFYDFTGSVFGCKETCNCVSSTNRLVDGNECDSSNGKCFCKEHIHGDKCDRIDEGYFIPLPDILHIPASEAKYVSLNEDRTSYSYEDFEGESQDEFKKLNSDKSTIEFDLKDIDSSDYAIFIHFAMDTPITLNKYADIKLLTSKNEIIDDYRFSILLSPNESAKRLENKKSQSVFIHLPPNTEDVSNRLQVKSDFNITIKKLVLVPKQFMDLDVLKTSNVIKRPCLAEEFQSDSNVACIHYIYENIDDITEPSREAYVLKEDEDLFNGKMDQLNPANYTFGSNFYDENIDENEVKDDDKNTVGWMYNEYDYDVNGTFGLNEKDEETEFHENESEVKLQKILKLKNRLTRLNKDQYQLIYKTSAPGFDLYHVLIEYHGCTENDDEDLNKMIYVSGTVYDKQRLDEVNYEATEIGFTLLPCPYSSVCRTIGKIESVPAQMRLSGETFVSLDVWDSLDEKNQCLISNIRLFPKRKFHMNQLKPFEECIARNGECLEDATGSDYVKKYRDNLGDSDEKNNENSKTFPNVVTLTAKDSDQPIIRRIPYSSPIVPLDNEQLDHVTFRVENNNLIDKQHIDYYIIVKYYQPESGHIDIDVELQDEYSYASNNPGAKGKLSLNHCLSKEGCRAIVYPVESEKSSDGSITDKQIQIPIGNVTSKLYTIFHPITHVKLTTSAKDKASKHNNGLSKRTFIDYISLVPKDNDNSNSNKFLYDLLTPGGLSEKKDFEKCLISDSTFEINPQLVNDDDFCRRSTLSLLTFNQLPSFQIEKCNCDLDGTVEDEMENCSSFGGNCKCKSNDIVGRRCDVCAPGMIKFPECVKCNCTSGLCLEDGTCTCPKGFKQSDDCNECDDGYYGFDERQACSSCNCNEQGLTSKALENRFTKIFGSSQKYIYSCNHRNGQCDCRENIGGRRCDQCKAGYWNYPECKKCDCNIDGVTDGICSQKSGECLCKSNVVGSQCNECKSGTFDLNALHVTGCIECYCSGVTNKCSAINMTKQSHDLSQLSGKKVYLENLESIENSDDLEKLCNKNIIDDPSNNYFTINESVDIDANVSDSRLYYKIDGNEFFKQFPALQAIDGELNGEFEVESVDDSIQSNGQNCLILKSKDNELLGNGMVVGWHCSLLSGNLFNYNVKFQSSNDWTILCGNEKELSRKILLSILSNLDYVLLSAQSFDNQIKTKLMKLNFNEGAAFPSNDDKYRIESCSCPIGSHYNGNSCNSCESGYHYTKINNVAYSENDEFISNKYQILSCTACNCYGHTNECDINSGECVDCGGNTNGTNCENCLLGHYRSINDPRIACRSCSCPSEINNYALACEVPSEEYKKCLCMEGYQGKNCEACANGYYGDPMVDGDSCNKCECNDNLDLNEPYACDDRTGECLICGYNTDGEKCDRCTDWYYGDPLGKNCTLCSCNSCGSSECDINDGSCTCLPNVLGEHCDQCAPNYYGINIDCEGCHPCQCSVASRSFVCNNITGQCDCKDGVEGVNCDRCKSGYFNYTENGCEKCKCDIAGTSPGLTCNNVTGQCDCLPGVTGERCTDCAPRYIINKEHGCVACDSCVNELLDSMDVIDGKLNKSRDNLDKVSISVNAIEMVGNIKNEMNEIEKKVKELEDPQMQKTIRETEDKYRKLQKDTDTQNLLIKHWKNVTTTTIENKEELKNKILDNERDMKNTTNELHRLYSEAVNVNKELKDSISRYRTIPLPPQLNNTIDYIIQNTKDLRNDVNRERLQELKVKLSEGDESFKELNKSLIESQKKLNGIQDNLKKFEVDHLDGIKDRVDEAQSYVNSFYEENSLAERTINKQKVDQLKKKWNELSNLKKENEERLNDAKSQLASYETNLNEILNGDDGKLKNIEESLTEIDELINDGKTNLEEMIKENGEFPLAIQMLNNEIVDFEKKVNELLPEDQMKSDVDRLTDSIIAYTEIAENLENYTNNMNEIEKIHNQVNKSWIDYLEKEKKEVTLNDMISELDDRTNQLKFFKENELELKLNELDISKSDINEINSDLAELSKDIELINKEIDELEDDHEKISIQDELSTLKTLRDDLKEDVEERDNKLKEMKVKVEKLQNEFNNMEQEEQSNILFRNSAHEKINNLEKDLDELIEESYTINNLESELNELQNDLQTDMNKLNNLVTQAEIEAGSMKAPVKFSGDSAMELNVPVDLTGYSKIGANIKPSYDASSGLIYFMGNKESESMSKQRYRRESNAESESENVEDFQTIDRKSDYIALILENGKPFYLFKTADINSDSMNKNEVQKIELSENACPPNEWTSIEVERYGSIIRYKVNNESNVKDILEENPGKFSMDMGKDVILHIGGQQKNYFYPFHLKEIPPFQGSVDSLLINDEIYPLWNFTKAEKIAADYVRETTEFTQSVAGFHLNDDAYLQMDPIHDTAEYHVHFMTDKPDNSIFFKPPLRGYDDWAFVLFMRNWQLKLAKGNFGDFTEFSFDKILIEPNQIYQLQIIFFFRNRCGVNVTLVKQSDLEVTEFHELSNGIFDCYDVTKTPRFFGQGSEEFVGLNYPKTFSGCILKFGNPYAFNKDQLEGNNYIRDGVISTCSSTKKSKKQRQLSIESDGFVELQNQEKGFMKNSYFTMTFQFATYQPMNNWFKGINKDFLFTIDQNETIIFSFYLGERKLYSFQLENDNLSNRRYYMLTIIFDGELMKTYLDEEYRERNVGILRENGIDLSYFDFERIILGADTDAINNDKLKSEIGSNAQTIHGCLKNFVINDKLYDFSTDILRSKNVKYNMCTLNKSALRRSRQFKSFDVLSS
ncbi:hypothetical protein SNEBB_000855 [Seison nebaliae]|nr:hypothetical protein SNEBB_000855 [Seison nebaliae]